MTVMSLPLTETYYHSPSSSGQDTWFSTRRRRFESVRRDMVRWQRWSNAPVLKTEDSWKHGPWVRIPPSSLRRIITVLLQYSFTVLLIYFSVKIVSVKSICLITAETIQMLRNNIRQRVREAYGVPLLRERTDDIYPAGSNPAAAAHAYFTR